MKSLFKKISSLFIIMLLAITMFGCGSESNDDYSIHTDLQKSYLSGDYKLIRTYAKGEEELSKPKPIVITWKADES